MMFQNFFKKYFLWLKLFFCLCCLLATVEGRILNRCSLAQELLKFGIAKQDLAIWSCIASFESRFNTSAIAHNGKWSTDYGLFQISDRYWCQTDNLHETRHSENRCKIDCQRLLSDDIRESVRCALIVKKLQGWRVWAAFNGICGRRKLNEIDECFWFALCFIKFIA